MTKEQQREIASKGGKTVSKIPGHMAELGRLGGTNSYSGVRAKPSNGKSRPKPNTRKKSKAWGQKFEVPN